MITKFNLYRSLLNEKGQVDTDTFMWNLDIRFTVEDRDHEDWYTYPVGTNFSFTARGHTFGDLAKVVFRRRGEIQPMLRVAEDVAGLLAGSRLHYLIGLRSSTWFEELLTVLGLLENFTQNYRTGPCRVVSEFNSDDAVDCDFDEVANGS